MLSAPTRWIEYCQQCRIYHAPGDCRPFANDMEIVTRETQEEIPAGPSPGADPGADQRDQQDRG